MTGFYYAVMLNHAQKDFAVYRDERYTFAEAYQHSVEFGAALVQRYRVAKGDRVAILSRNNPQWMMAFMGATAVGAVAVPMNGWWTTEELDYGFADSGARVVVADRTRIERLAPLVKKHGLQLISIDDCSGIAIEHTPFRDLLKSVEGAHLPPADLALVRPVLEARGPSRNRP